ncbi:MAG: hypothetical protein GY749_42825 [Desulfobacteraceae bacterium]|nr:hypothetical protein [Desulfobacteraceae bacterium]
MVLLIIHWPLEITNLFIVNTVLCQALFSWLLNFWTQKKTVNASLNSSSSLGLDCQIQAAGFGNPAGGFKKWCGSRYFSGSEVNTSFKFQ